MMKKHVYIFFVFCSFTTLFAQKKYTVKQANELFAKKEYIKAAEAFEQLGQSKEVLQNLGE
jgi:predicted metal-dependent hydrolase